MAPRSKALPLTILAVLALAPLVPAAMALAPAPDLLVSDVLWSPVAPVGGDAVTFTAHVTNHGAGDAGPSVVRFLVDGAPVGDVALDGLAAGASVDVASPAWTADVGRHVVRVVVDADHQVTESNEANDARSESFIVARPPLPDLVVLDVGTAVPSPVAGDDVVFVATVKNQGSADAGAFSVGFAVDGAALDPVDVPGLAAGESLDVHAGAWHATAGARNVRALADVGTAVNEASEANNARTERFNIAAGPLADLVVQDITVAPAEADDHDSIVFTARVANAGSRDAGPFAVAWSIDGEAVGNVAVDSLAAGAAVDVQSAAWDATSGNHTVRAVADAADAIEESREGNNARAEPFTVEHVGSPSIRAQLDSDEAKVTICHVPPGNPDNAHTITVGLASLGVHLGNGDHEGACKGDDGPAEASTGGHHHEREGASDRHGDKDQHEAGEAGDDDDDDAAASEHPGRGPVQAEAHVETTPAPAATASVVFGPAGAAFTEVSAPMLAAAALAGIGAFAVVAWRRR